jgi:hypothetical protein
MQFDPRTVARDIPGIFDDIFPQLTRSIVAHFNNLAVTAPVQPLNPQFLSRSTLQRSMLFELGYTVGERLIDGEEHIDWESCFAETLRRQRSYFDATLPDQLTSSDQALAETIGRNLVYVMTEISRSRAQAIDIQPRIPGLEWIATGRGDFAVGRTLVEVKCTVKRFSSADYRQVAMYWLLSYAASIEERGIEWEDFVLLNPRSGDKLEMRFDAFLSIISSGRTKVDILQRFQTLVGSRLIR